MKLTAKSRYGIRAAIELALRWQKGPVQIKIIAENENISLKYLEQLLTQMKSADLVQSIRGAKGGYYLTKSPEQISLYDIIKVIEGPIEPVECMSGMNICGDCDQCAVKEISHYMSDMIAEELKKHDLKSLAEKTLELRNAGSDN
ncbi:Cysteine metabolism repressor [Sedimentisphaera cyanobacteriorum]|uniref:Cysteine metabolism repressor n=1 Tax=Sedimentisphaera cyanobacteriorum TaxID=1940790 RepID=A0A1Q2HN26_9BACT|nr:Rrf2 family transcriptional regulator [Sedimentisphaera cyanobacteriorum]AQQ08691.1 Cysteine metabolism repressor [Sedimentisphaera cyanobacteriorum]